jgi:hypothetical protein
MIAIRELSKQSLSVFESFTIIAVKERKIEDLNLDFFLFEDDTSLDGDISAADCSESLGLELFVE